MREWEHSVIALRRMQPKRDQTHNLGYVPWLEIEPTTLQYTGRHSNHATLARATVSFFMG